MSLSLYDTAEPLVGLTLLWLLLRAHRASTARCIIRASQAKALASSMSSETGAGAASSSR